MGQRRAGLNKDSFPYQLADLAMRAHSSKSAEGSACNSRLDKRRTGGKGGRPLD